MRNSPTPEDKEIKLSPAVLKKNEAAIMSFIFYGNSDEKRKLNEVAADLTVHPQIRRLISECLMKEPFYTQRTSNPETTSIKEQVRSNRAAA